MRMFQNYLPARRGDHPDSGIDEDAIAKLSENDRDDALSSLFDRLEAEKNATSRRVVLENREI
jgi:hypothetical protein